MSDLALLLFRLDRITYAVTADQVRYVDLPEQITPVPQAPPFVEGVMYSRGAIIPVVNLRVRFGLPRQERNLKQRVIVTELGERVVGLLVDEAREFLRVDAARIMLPPQMVLTPSAAFLAGVVVEGQRPIFLIDLERVLSPEEVPQLPQTDNEDATPPEEGG